MRIHPTAKCNSNCFWIFLSQVILIPSLHKQGISTTCIKRRVRINLRRMKEIQIQFFLMVKGACSHGTLTQATNTPAMLPSMKQGGYFNSGWCCLSSCNRLFSFIYFTPLIFLILLNPHTILPQLVAQTLQSLLPEQFTTCPGWLRTFQHGTLMQWERLFYPQLLEHARERSCTVNTLLSPWL